VNAEPNNPFAGLGLPATFVPAPAAWRLGKLEMETTAGHVKLHVVVVDTAAGRLAFTLDDAGARKFAEAITAQVSGITVATVLPANNGGHL
jgi:hypothetical protein